MDLAAVRSVSRVPHGGERDASLLDFSANVNPYYPAGVEEVYAASLEHSRRYPDDDYAAFREAAAAYVGCDPDAVIPTAGGLAALRLSLAVTLEPGSTAVLPAPSFGEYAREVELQGGVPHFVPQESILETDEKTLESSAIAVVCSPNNPTGNAHSLDDIARFARRCDLTATTLLVDEAFLGFTDRASAATLDAENVIVARSLTKLFGLPGLRAGFAVATGDPGRRLGTARRAWSLGTPAARVGTVCMRDDAFVAETRNRVARERERLQEVLSDRYDVYPSSAPFLLLDVGDRDVESMIDNARQHGIALRDATTFRRLDSHVRVAVKDHEANDKLLEVLL